ncbi:MAG: NADP-dependent isocitrate dehydrogenase, partial [Desulfuromonadales bacterium]|nr:NADP-dependent isocitrate dehydrogenase [Desulfuromonadales bacterium]
QALAAQDKDTEMKARFAKVSAEIEKNVDKIDAEFIDCQGSPVDVGGYFRPDPIKAATAMRPSATLNAIIDSM